MRKYIVIAAIAAIVLGSVIAWEKRENSRLRKELSRVSIELAHAQLPLEPTVIRDSIPVVSQAAVEVAAKDMKDALAAERQLIKDLELRVNQLASLQTTVIHTTDTVYAEYKQQDSLFSYHDQWADLSLSLKDTTFYYNIRDSLATVVYREYRHRFLWWRWGTKGYRLKIVNFNPRSKVTYNKYVYSK